MRVDPGWVREMALLFQSLGSGLMFNFQTRLQSISLQMKQQKGRFKSGSHKCAISQSRDRGQQVLRMEIGLWLVPADQIKVVRDSWQEDQRFHDRIRLKS